MRQIFRGILIAGFLTISLVNAEPYKEKSFPSDEVINKNITTAGRNYLDKVLGGNRGATDIQTHKHNVIGKINKDDNSQRVFYCVTTTVPQEICLDSHIFKLDTGVWIMEHNWGEWSIIEK